MQRRIKKRTAAAEESSHSHIHFNEVNYLLPNCPKGLLDITMCPGKKRGLHINLLQQPPPKQVCLSAIERLKAEKRHLSRSQWDPRTMMPFAWWERIRFGVKAQCLYPQPPMLWPFSAPNLQPWLSTTTIHLEQEKEGEGLRQGDSGRLFSQDWFRCSQHLRDSGFPCVLSWCCFSLFCYTSPAPIGAFISPWTEVKVFTSRTDRYFSIISPHDVKTDEKRFSLQENVLNLQSYSHTFSYP